MPLPFLLVGDHPMLPSGLGRILRDLAQQLANDRHLDLDVRIVGCRPEGNGPDGCAVGGRDIPTWSFTASDDLSESIAQHVYWAWQRWWGAERGIVLTIWDAARIHALAHAAGPWEHWAYVPVDAEMPRGWTGPAAEVIQRVSRVLAYGAFGARVLKPLRSDGVSFLPHGLTENWFGYHGDSREGLSNAERRRWIGVVMTNQPRKDWGLTVATIAELRHRGHKVKLWAHTDRVVGPAWSLPQLLDVHGLRRDRVKVSLSTDFLTDRELRLAYQQCGVVLLPSLGEGFGYPLVEALASGVPAVHSTYAGGAELVPRAEWKVPVRATRLDGPHALIRPVFDPRDWANAIERVWDWQDGWPDHGAGYCQGSVEHLRWSGLWPRWSAWVQQGLRERED